MDRVRAGEDAGRTEGAEAAPRLTSFGIAAGIVGCLGGVAYGEHALTDLLARRLAAVLPGPPELWRLAGHGGFLVGLGVGASTVWQRAMHKIEARTSTAVPVLGEDQQWVPPTVSGSRASLVSWAGMGRDGRLHALASVRPKASDPAPPDVPDLSIETVMGTPARAAPVQVYVGLDNAPTPRERVDLAMAELDRTGALDRSLLVLVSPTGTGYVNYVATAALQYLAQARGARASTPRWADPPGRVRQPARSAVQQWRSQTSSSWVIPLVRPRPTPCCPRPGSSLSARAPTLPCGCREGQGRRS